MPQAIADPDELERFAQCLCGFRDEISGAVTMLNAHFATLAETWQDQEQHKFEAEYLDLLRAHVEFCRRIDEHVPYLKQKAVHLRDYLEA